MNAIVCPAFQSSISREHWNWNRSCVGSLMVCPQLLSQIFGLINNASTLVVNEKDTWTLRNHLMYAFTIWDMHLSYILCWFVKDHHVRMFPNLRGRGLSRDECTSLHYRIEMEETISLWILICDICLLLVVSADKDLSIVILLKCYRFPIFARKNPLPGMIQSIWELVSVVPSVGLFQI